MNKNGLKFSPLIIPSSATGAPVSKMAGDLRPGASVVARVFGAAASVLCILFIVGCTAPKKRASIPTCLDVDTTPIDELLAERGRSLSAPPDSAMSKEDSALVRKYQVSANGNGLLDRKLLDLHWRLSSARVYRELLKICPAVISDSKLRFPANAEMTLHNQESCADAAFYSGDFRVAMDYLDSIDAGVAEGKVHGVLFEGLDPMKRLRMRAEINSLWRRDREVLRLMLPGMWAERSLRLAILRNYRFDEIIAEFDRAIDSLSIANYEDAPTAIQAKSDTLFEFLGKRKKVGWTRLFGVEMVVWPPGEEPPSGFPRDAYIERITDAHLYGEMYCLPSARDSARDLPGSASRSAGDTSLSNRQR